jgi:hypothetical protein
MVDKLFNFFLVRYGKLWAERYANLGLTMNDIKSEWEAELCRLTPQELQAGIDACRTKAFPPTLPEFVKMCWSGHPSSDAAWAIAVKSIDENNTVTWTKEIMQAWDRCRAVYEDGDKIGARMAFKAEYESMNLSQRPEWIVSEGFDKEKRLIEMNSAQAAGLIGMSEQAKMIGVESTSSTAKQKAMERLKELRVALKKMPSEEYIPNPDIARIEELKRISAEKVRRYLEGK